MTPPDCTSEVCRGQVLWLLGKWRAAEAKAAHEAERTASEIRRLRRRLRRRRHKRRRK